MSSRIKLNLNNKPVRKCITGIFLQFLCVWKQGRLRRCSVMAYQHLLLSKWTFYFVVLPLLTSTPERPPWLVDVWYASFRAYSSHQPLAELYHWVPSNILSLESSVMLWWHHNMVKYTKPRLPFTVTVYHRLWVSDSMKIEIYHCILSGMICDSRWHHNIRNIVK